MRERPILFSAPMVRAILEGRKTQTRRVAKPRRNPSLLDGSWTDDYVLADGNRDWLMRECPYGVPGDRLWVRETWQGPLIDEELEEEFHQSPDYFKKPAFCAYRATDTLDAINADGEELGWRPSIHMPRWASRILLEVVSVRVERLKEISQRDAMAEGAPPSHPSIDRVSNEYGFADFSRSWYAQLWEQINGAGSWDANPWVWVVEFKRVTP